MNFHLVMELWICRTVDAVNALWNQNVVMVATLEREDAVMDKFAHAMIFAFKEHVLELLQKDVVNNLKLVMSV